MRADRWLLLALLMGVSHGFRAQDPQFTQFYALPTYMNPAFAGTGMQSRFALAWRDQWPSIPGAFVSYNAAWDHYMDKLNSGVGLLVTHDRAGTGALRYTSVAAQYAYEIELKRKVFLRPALQVGMVNHAVDLSRLTFGDQLARGGAVPTMENGEGRSIRYADMGAGVLFFTPKLWLGASMLHLNKPDQGLMQGEGGVPRKLTVHGGYRHRIRGRVIKEHAENLVFAFNYRAQGRYDQMDIGAYYEREPFFAGLWYRGLPFLKSYAPGYANSDAVAVLLGFTVKDLRVGYSYDITLSQLAGRSGGAHEITLGYEIAERRYRRSITRRRIVPCAKF